MCSSFLSPVWQPSIASVVRDNCWAWLITELYPVLATCIIIASFRRCKKGLTPPFPECVLYKAYSIYVCTTFISGFPRDELYAAYYYFTWNVLKLPRSKDWNGSCFLHISTNPVGTLVPSIHMLLVACIQRPLSLCVLSTSSLLLRTTDPFNDWGGAGNSSFVPVSGGNDTKIAPTGDIFDQLPGGMSLDRGKLPNNVGDNIDLSPKGAVLVTSTGTESSYSSPPQSLNNSTGETCSNGFLGIEPQGVCCASGCPQYGGSGCGSQAPCGLTNSLTNGRGNPCTNCTINHERRLSIQTDTSTSHYTGTIQCLPREFCAVFRNSIDP